MAHNKHAADVQSVSEGDRRGRSLSNAYIDRLTDSNPHRYPVLQHCKSGDDLFQGAAYSYEHPAYRDAHADLFAVRVSRQGNTVRYGRITRHGDPDLSDRGVGCVESTTDLP